MAQVEVNLRDIYRVLRKRRWIVLLAPLLMGGATFLVTQPPAPVYESKAQVKISRSSVLGGVLTDYISYGNYDNMATQMLVVTSRPVLEDVARRLNMSKAGERPDGAVDQLKKQLTARQQGNSDILEIMATAPSREQAIALANTTSDVYIAQSARAKNKRIDETVEFVRTQLSETEGELGTAEEAYSSFKRAHAVTLAMDPGQELDIHERRFLYQQKVQDARAALATLARVQQTKEYELVSQAVMQLDEPLARSLGDEVTRRSAAVAELNDRRVDLLRYQREAAPQVVAVSTQLSSEERRLEAQVSALTQRLTRVASEYKRLDNALAKQQAEIARQPMALRDLGTIETAIKEKQELVSNLRRRLQEAEIRQKEKIEDITFVERAQSAGQLAQNGRLYQSLIGVLIGILLGGVFAFVLESMDTSIGTIEDVEEFINSPVLGVIPHIEVKDVRRQLKLDDFPSHVSDDDVTRFLRLVTQFDPKSVAAEAYRTLRTNIASAMAKTKGEYGEKENDKQGNKVILITSSVLQEGKTTSACNLAVAFAQAGQKTLLIDADLRRPRVDKIFGVEKVPGVSEILFETRGLMETCRTVEDLILGNYGLKMTQLTPGLGFLHILPAGRSVDNPAELLNSEAMVGLLAEARRNFDIVLVDVAPVLPVADASILAPKVDGVIVSYQIGRIGREVLKRSKLRLESLGGAMLGIIMNDIQAEIDYKRTDYYYHYRYVNEPAPSPEPQTWAHRLKQRASGWSRSSQGSSRSGNANRSRRAQSGPATAPRKSAPAPPSPELMELMGLTNDKRK